MESGGNEGKGNGGLKINFFTVRTIRGPDLKINNEEQPLFLSQFRK